MSLSPQFLDELRARVTLSTLIGRSVKLVKAGREFKACCPFHNEKSPSFYVNDDKGFYHCFGCGAHGDAIRFLTEAKGLTFIDAVKELAQGAGMEVPAPDPRAAQRNEMQAGLHDVMAAAASWFQEQLGGIAGAEARAYLQRRGIDERLVKKFGIGFAPDSRGKLRTALKSFGDAKLIETGLLILVEDKEPYDRFRGRVMIPIQDQRGRVIAFGGRILDKGEPKYLNSPDTPLFDKGRTLFNIERASAASRKANRVIAVEGYMDVIALAKAGIDEAVAANGTALTEAQLERMWRMTEIPLLCFDGDKAGQKAAVRAAQRALPMIAPGRTLRFALLPGGQDPDDLVKSGGVRAVEQVLDEAISLDELLWRAEYEAQPLSTPEARAGLRKRLGDLAGSIQDRDVRELYQAEFRRRFDELFGSAQRRPFERNFQPFQPRQQRRPGQPWKPEPLPPSRAAHAVNKSGVNPMVTRAVMAGLLRFPALFSSHMEAIGQLQLGDERLDRLRAEAFEAGFSGGPLEKEGLETILAEAGLGAVVEELKATNALAFSFLRGNADPDRAMRDLSAAIEAMAARPLLDAALREATERLGMAADDAGLEEQRRLLAAREAADRALTDLALGEDGGGA
ncbi:DNA primase [Rhizorhabdus wittichii]|uniref:DNA primase n=2 Tax=Rhizorhabdus wittichii TaxID=160791 RepID=A0A9J9LCH7_RHIWR|nr:DNA primase [Rhizorhabdus wittichii]ABQ66800.1 DNA primase [Rhizorhabdus wittichii RW1]ARR56630.1 DNA primase [Rhizorhabdus wittichii DC-6]QTH22749.1 DNA primase [Rhizorhabdus wittichii]